MPKLRETGKKDAEAVSYDWDQAQALLQTGNYEVVPDEGTRTVDQPALQSPSPGTAPFSQNGDGDEPDFDRMTKAELEAYAEEKGIDLGDATLKADILEKVKAA